MKAKLFIAKLLTAAMLMNSVLPAFAAVNGMTGSATEPFEVEDAQYVTATDSEADINEEIIEEEIMDDVSEVISEEIYDVQEVELDASDLPEDEELLNGFIESLFYPENGGGIALFGNYGVNSLDTVDAYVYDELYRAVSRIAKGTTSSAVVEVDLDRSWTAEDLGVTSVIEDGQISDQVMEAFTVDFGYVVDLLLLNCPYELYWMNKTASSKAATNIESISVSTDETIIQTKGEITVTFPVSEAYQDSADEQSVNAEKVAAAKIAAENARAFYDGVESESLLKYEMAERFKEEICALVDYDHDTADHADTVAFGDPWQMVYVFDGDDTTKVVCEGYAKAFQYLCDLADIECYTVTGDMTVEQVGGTESERHMWNIVTLGDVNYLVDVTNCDGVKGATSGNAIGFPNYLFLAGAEGSIENGYVVTIDENTTVEYDYDADTKAIYSDSELVLSDKSYYDVLEGSDAETEVGFAGLLIVTGGKWVRDGQYFTYEVNGNPVSDCLVDSDGKLSYIDGNGYMVTGFYDFEDGRRYFDKDGFMISGTSAEIDDKLCTFDGDGIYIANPPYTFTKHPKNQVGVPGMTVTFKVETEVMEGSYPSVQWFYKVNDGWEEVENATGESLTVEVTEENLAYRYRCKLYSEIDGLKLYSDTVRVKDSGWLEYEDGKWRIYEAGSMVTGWYQEETRTFYLATSDEAVEGLLTGDLATGFCTIDGKLYYFAVEEDDTYVLGQMWTDGAVEVDDVIYVVNADGTLTPSESDFAISLQPETYWGEGDEIQFTVEAIGADSFKWEYSTDKGTTWNDVTDAQGLNANTNVVTVVWPTDEEDDVENYWYRCEVKSGDKSQYSDAVQIHVTPFPVVQGTWVGDQCFDKNGETCTDEFAVWEDKIYFLDDDGHMVTSEFVQYSTEKRTDLYYFGSDGAMVTNAWKEYIDERGNSYWRYLQSNGRAAKSTKKVFVEDGIEKVYAFDSDAYMMTGWAIKDTETGDVVYASDWRTAKYYFSESENQVERGIRASGLTAIKVGNEEYTFYFSKSNGEKIVNKENYDIDGNLYNINADGVVTLVSTGGGNSGEGPSDSIAVDEFVDMNGLQALLNDGDMSERILVYIGNTDFVVSSDLEVPNYINLQFNGKNLVINQGVTFTINNWIECGDLIVNGIMNANGHINADDNLSVSGKLNAPMYNISLNYPAEIDGLENIVFGDEGEEHPWMQVTMRAPFETVAELIELSNAIANDKYRNEERVGYNLEICGEHGSFDIDQDVTVPAHARLELYNTGFVTVTSLGSLVNKGELNVLVPLEVYGILANTGVVSVSHDDDWEATLSLRDGGKYSGNGEFQVHTRADISGLDEVLFGFNLDEMYFRSNTESDGITHWWLDNSDGIFATFEKLESIVASGEFSTDRLRYVGTKPLEIARNLTLPSGVELDLNGQDLKVLSDAAFTVKGQVYCKNLNVEGTMNVSEWLRAEESVTVSGTLNANRALNAGSKLEITDTGILNVANNSININYLGEVIGIDRIQFAQEWQEVIFVAEFEDENELAGIIEWLADESNCMDHERVNYMINMPWNNPDQATIGTRISKDITIPAHAELQLSGNRTFVVDEGATLTIDGRFYLGAPLTLKGSLVNNGQVNVNYYPNNPNNNNRGTITLESGDSYSGSGRFYVQADSAVASIASVLFGFNMDDYDISENIWDDGTKQWQLKNSAGLIKLGTPKNLRWGIEYREEWIDDGNGGEDIILHPFERNGSMSWETVTPDQAEVQIHIYRQGETTPCHSERWGFGEDHQPQYRSVDSFRIRDLDSGTYYFTVQSLGDYIEYCDSDVATSGLYTYVKPAEKLDRLADLKWVDKDDNFVTWIDWADPVDPEYVDGYQIQLYYCDTVDGEYVETNGMRGFGNPNTEHPIDDHHFQENGDGYYKFKVRALSENIETIGNGKWSAFSPVYDTRSTSVQVNNDLTDIIADVNNATITQDKILETVQQMDTQELKTALLVDQDSSDATQKLAELEDKVGGAADIEVTQDASAFNAADVSIVGANLNNKSADTEDEIKLVVDKPEKDHVIPELYNSSVAVSFSMELENVEDPKNLEVPVKITLPIPSSINPQFVVIFHYDVYGDHEIIHPYVYQNGGKWYADFVLTSFSDFVMTTIHELERIEAKAATETNKGNIEHYVCECCGAMFADAEATEELTIEEVEIPKLSHVCQWDDGVVVTPSTCTTKGQMKYTCKVPGCGDVKYKDIPAAHKLEKVARIEATKTSTGNIEHYKCTVCGKLFSDAAGSKELTLAEVTIPKKKGSSGGGGGGGGSSSGGGGGSSKKPASTGSASVAGLPSYVVTGQWTVVDGKWGFTDNSGLVYKNKWAAVHNPYANLAAGQAAFDWFYFDANGQMASGWVLDAGRWYYTNPVADGTQGRMLVGWQLINGLWYYLNPVSDGTKGAMLTNTWIDGYYLDANGVWDQTKTK